MLLATQAAFAQPVPRPGYLPSAIDGDNAVGAHFALAACPGGATGFFYLADHGRLIASACADLTGSDAISLTNPMFDRGRYVSATSRPARFDRPILAYYDATDNDLMTLDCLSSECLFGNERTREGAGNGGQDLG